MPGCGGSRASSRRSRAKSLRGVLPPDPPDAAGTVLIATIRSKASSSRAARYTAPIPARRDDAGDADRPRAAPLDRPARRRASSSPAASHRRREKLIIHPESQQPRPRPGPSSPSAMRSRAASSRPSGLQRRLDRFPQPLHRAVEFTGSLLHALLSSAASQSRANAQPRRTVRTRPVPPPSPPRVSPPSKNRRFTIRQVPAPGPPTSAAAQARRSRAELLKLRGHPFQRHALPPRLAARRRRA